MENGKTSKKLTKIEEDGTLESTSGTSTFVPTDESLAKARNLRIIAILSWVAAIGFEVWAIMKLKEVPVNMGWLIGLIVVELAFAVTGSWLWKKANRLDPASWRSAWQRRARSDSATPARTQRQLASVIFPTSAKYHFRTCALVTSAMLSKPGITARSNCASL